MRILVFNQLWCVDEMRAAGHEVRTVGMHDECDVIAPPPLIHINTILSSYLPDFKPERILYWDNSAPVSVLGLEDIEIPTLFYSVDTHHHAAYHKYLAHVFDKTLVAQKDYLHHFVGFDQEVEWMPLWASRFVDVSEVQTYGAVFVGNMDAKLNPDRVKFFEELKKKRDVYTTMGEFWKIFPHAQVVVNQTVLGDLNFRVFESLMCGVPLLTEVTQNGLFDLFTDGKHLLTYQKGNVESAVEKIDWVLSHPHESRELARAGRQQVLDYHLPQHRAQYVLNILQDLRKKKRSFKRYAMFVNFSVLARRMDYVDTSYAKKALLHAMRIIDDACRDGEPISTEVACLCVLSAVTYDKTFNSNAGEGLLLKLSEAYPEEKVLHLARIRGLLNRGAVPDAQKVAQDYFEDLPNVTFKNAEHVITTILSELMP